MPYRVARRDMQEIVKHAVLSDGVKHLVAIKARGITTISLRHLYDSVRAFDRLRDYVSAREVGMLHSVQTLVDKVRLIQVYTHDAINHANEADIDAALMLYRTVLNDCETVLRVIEGVLLRSHAADTDATFRYACNQCVICLKGVYRDILEVKGHLE